MAMAFEERQGFSIDAHIDHLERKVVLAEPELSEVTVRAIGFAIERDQIMNQRLNPLNVVSETS